MKTYDATRFTWRDFWIIVACAVIIVVLEGVR
jgi:hypothetical protein